VEQLTCVSAARTTKLTFDESDFFGDDGFDLDEKSTVPDRSEVSVDLSNPRGTQEQRGLRNAGVGVKESLLDKGKRFMESDKFLPTMVAPLAMTALIFAVDKIPDRYKSPGAPLSDDGNELNDDRRRAIAGGPVASGPTAGGGASTTSPVRTVLAGRRFTSLGSSDVRRKVALGA
jgi:hypothetical protein